MGILLTIVAYLLLTILKPIGILWAIIRAGSLKKIDTYFYNVAFSIDQTGNVFCCYLFNSLLIKTNGYKFGNPDETVSHVLGVNKTQFTLTITGKFICWVLDSLERNHVENAAKNEQ